MDYCWIAIMKDMDIEKYLNVQEEQKTEQIFSLLYEYLDKLRIENCGYTFFLASYGTTTAKAGSSFLYFILLWIY